MAINLSTAGVQLLYAPETTAGTRPSTGFTRIKGIKSTPSLNPSPETLETTTLDELEYKYFRDTGKRLPHLSAGFIQYYDLCLKVKKNL